MTENQEEPSYIVPPKDPNTLRRLALKLEEYQRRLVGKGKDWEYKHPDLARLSYDKYRHAEYGTIILKRLLNNNNPQPVNTWALSLELFEKWPDSFNAGEFNNICGVINYYCGNTPETVPDGGTGLPRLPSEEKTT